MFLSAGDQSTRSIAIFLPNNVVHRYLLYPYIVSTDDRPRRLDSGIVMYLHSGHFQKNDKQMSVRDDGIIPVYQFLFHQYHSGTRYL